MKRYLKYWISVLKAFKSNKKVEFLCLATYLHIYIQQTEKDYFFPKIRFSNLNKIIQKPSIYFPFSLCKFLFKDKVLLKVCGASFPWFW